jgi:hypothetical protein
MSFQVVPKGTLIIREKGSEKSVQIQADTVNEKGEWLDTSKLSFKDDDHQFEVTFSTDTDFGTFEWLVILSNGMSGATIESAEPTKTPNNVEIQEDFTFEIEEVSKE